MSSQAPERSPLEQARAETNELIHKVQDDLERLRTAPVNELETRIDSLNNSFKSTQDSIIANVESALGTSETHSQDLEQSLQAEKERLDALTSELSTQRQEAKTKHSRLTVELDSLKIDHGLIKRDLDKAKSALEEASQRTTGLEKDLQVVKQQNVDLQAEVDSAKRKPADLQERLKAVEQQNADLEADRNAAAQRASTVEDEMKILKSHFKQISDITALVFPPEQQPTVSQPEPSFPLPPTNKRSVEERKDRSQNNDHRTRSLDPHASNPTSDKAPDLLLCHRILEEVMDKKNSLSNHYFLSPRNRRTRDDLICQGAKSGPRYLVTMKEKLARGLYSSVNSLKEDFDRMIANCKRLNPPDSHVCTAAKERTRIFEQTWSAKRSSSHESQDHTSQDQGSRRHKRKASTEDPVSSESDGKAKKSREGLSLNDNVVQPVDPVADESVHPTSSPTHSQPATTSAESIAQQGSPKDVIGGVGTESDQQQSTELVSQPVHIQRMGETDRLLCEEVLDAVQNDITTAHDIQFFLASSGLAQPMNLTVIDKKLREGAYISVESFRQDFDSMIKLYKARDLPILLEASSRLEMIFEDTWTGFHAPDSVPQLIVTRDHTAEKSNSRGHKRKASTEDPGSSESDGKAKKAREDSPLNDNAVQSANPAADECTNPASPRPEQLSDSSQTPAGVDVAVWKGHLTTGPSIESDFDLNVTAKRVSVVKPANTQNNWKRFLPDKLHVTAHAKEDKVEDELFASNFYLSEDSITLCLEPAAETDTSAFKELSKYLITRERYATISHRSHHEVVKIYLIPALSKYDLPDDIHSPAHRVIPKTQTEDVMFMVVIHCVRHEDRKKFRQIWDNIIKAVQNPDMSGLVGIRDHLIQRPLPIYRPTLSAVFSAGPSMFSHLPLSQDMAGNKLKKYRPSLLKLSYPMRDLRDPSDINGVKLPEFVFILGVVDSRSACYDDLLVVDINKKDRPLWVIPCLTKYESRTGTSIGLLTSKFPQSWKEWEELISADLRERHLTSQRKVTGLRMERI